MLDPVAKEGSGWSEYRLERRFEKVSAPADIAALFESYEGESLLARHFVLYDGRQPMQMCTSYLRWSDVKEAPLVETGIEPWSGGAMVQLAGMGINVAKVSESFTVGMPTAHEAATLNIAAGVPVLRYTRSHIDQNGRIVEVAHPVVRRGDSTVIDFEIEVR
ncbi:UTRA domain-containing protein [Streptomyces sp. NPDC026665]|uniref:UTRA domain-containing protein n=1 Tax=Streptomyces sp. NPDC026665 TaxID=3154798 RepID=UPI0033D7E348